MPELQAAEKPRVITISTVTIVKVVMFALSLAFLWFIRDLVMLFFVALMLSTIINPLASWFESMHIRRGVAVLLLYAGILGVIVIVATSLVPAVLLEVRDLLTNADSIWARFLETLGPVREFVSSRGLQDNLTDLLSNVLGGAAAPGGVVATIRDFIGAIVSLVIVLVVTYYLVVSEDSLKRLFRTVAPEAYQPYLIDLSDRIQKALGNWVRGQLILSLIIAVAVYVALTILGVKYALVLALAAGIAEFIPYIGPIIASIPAVIIALTAGPFRAMLVAVMYIVIQQAENHILVPKVMHRVTGLHPVISIFALLIGVKLAGIVGALLAIPVATVLSIVIGDAFRMVKSNR